MATKAHSLVSVASRHPLPKYEYANAAARTGATGFASTDINALAHQQDNDTYWILTATTPTWLQVVTAPAAGYTAASVPYADGSGNLVDDGVNFSYAAGIVTLSSGVTFTGGGTLSTTSNGNLVLLPNGTGITVVGDAGSTSQALANKNDLFVNGKVEADGVVYPDGGVIMGSVGTAIQMTTNCYIASTTGNNYGVLVPRSSSQSPNTTVLSTGAASNHILVCESGDRTYAFNHPLQTNPTVFVHSANQSTTECAIITHDQTDAIFSSGTNTVKIPVGMKHNVTTVAAATYDLLPADYLLHVTYTGTGAVTSLTLPTAQTVSGRVIRIKDAGGNAATNNITIDTEGAQTIDGAATLVLNTDYAWVSLYCDGSDWFVIGG